jgi:ubiquinone/menaquinone biosynthesis C-methylase UbiE
METLQAEKLEAIRCWTNDPCGAVEGTPGTAEYAEALVAARVAYAPWMAEVLGYNGARGLDVLDVGCGQGIDLIQLARAGARVTGIDLTPRHVELAREHLEALGLDGVVLEGDAERLPFPDDSFDLVTSNGVLHHTPDMEAALREIRRVLRPDGEARLIVYHRDSVHYWLTHRLYEGRISKRVPLRDVERSSIDAHPLVRVYSRREYRRVLTRAGFRHVQLAVRHYRPGDAYLLWGLQRRVRALGAEPVNALIGRAAGWYLCAVAS